MFNDGEGRDLIQDEEGENTLVFSGVSKSDLLVEFRESYVYVGRGAGVGTEPGEGFVFNSPPSLPVILHPV